ncbi:MAG: MerR family transcriptional regulator, partial [Lachnospiraceae bacterium]|nr:MerR family transcriptional regulator [Lachnospiraceae bacterium]
MDIREVEKKTGLARSNIRYYEKEGFLQPCRQANGYRDYSDENVQLLLKIKLLRRIGVTVERIRQLQTDEVLMDSVLAERLADIERGRSELDTQEGVCRRMQEDQVTFKSLDASRYLALAEEIAARQAEERRQAYTGSAGIAADTAGGQGSIGIAADIAGGHGSAGSIGGKAGEPTSAGSIAGKPGSGSIIAGKPGLAGLTHEQYVLLKDVEEPEPHPWLRFFARALDFQLVGMVLNLFIHGLFRVHPPLNSTVSNLEQMGILVVSVALVWLVEPLLLARFATTPGKWLLGISIRHESGRLLTVSEARERTVLVLQYGCGFQIPVYSTWRKWKSYKDYVRPDVTLYWDGNCEISFDEEGRWRPWAWLGAAVCLALVSLVITTYAMQPPHRGDVTVEEFVENYNDMKEYLATGVFDMAGPDLYIMKDGRLGFKARPGDEADEDIPVGEAYAGEDYDSQNDTDTDGADDETGTDDEFWDGYIKDEDTVLNPDGSVVIDMSPGTGSYQPPEVTYSLENGYIQSITLVWEEEDYPVDITPMEAQAAAQAFIGADRSIPFTYGFVRL